VVDAADLADEGTPRPRYLAAREPGHAGYGCQGGAETTLVCCGVI
jgi:hypothetical protein